MADPVRNLPAPQEIIDPWEGAPSAPPKLDPLIVDPWELLGQAGLDEQEGDFENPWADSRSAPLLLDPSILDPWHDGSRKK